MVTTVGRILPFNEYADIPRVSLYEGVIPPTINPTPPLQILDINFQACRLREDCSHCPYITAEAPFSCKVPTLSRRTNKLYSLDFFQAQHAVSPSLCCLHTIT